MYVYIARETGQHRSTDTPDALLQAAACAVIPKDMQSMLGKLNFVMHLDLTQTDKLARANKQQVLQSLQQKGYFIQLPPDGLVNPHQPAPEGLRGA
jgi:uncharacterized protein YcgL (UPF0745 family)